jgi:hypothetical protein
MKLWRSVRHEHVIAMFVAMFILVGLMLFVTDNARASIYSNDPLHAWDYVSGKYEPGNAHIQFDESWEPFVHQFTKDSWIWPDDYGYPHGLYDPCYPTTPTSTSWGGVAEITLYHTDNNPAGAPGFQQTQNWKLVYCDKDGDGTGLDNDDLATVGGWVEVPTCTLRILNQDYVTGLGCGGNCQDELYTTVVVNCDLNCDDDVDDPGEGWPAGGLCIYWEGQTPSTTVPMWGGNFQARISAGGGDKTVNFDIDAQTDVTLASFTAHSAAGPYVAVLLGVGVGGVALLYWRSRRRRYHTRP